ncbi:hypothetical protein QNO08_08650 [Arthrobacter sp. zg-Y820]|uniref:hypothetical protein n=1 Tax=unclassified Arthrobacter TaxID=235627 RepID=UPI001E54B807|nr:MULTISPECIES: hypothetical protein [unclassified Arthrobacter]MCC9196815.1 hypothetical protein [Arthrobacter sp. zg-Y820]MDK1279677.1 hypothetical protein [Arthrobacter sp. zg.Y820]MDK1358708.1 hypothetical protein [Arthrobacter sp. zg-Y1219]WIB07954.1 hypothetical protein QNO08_08650 [Arthrobacter sp. zg-Y820]
MDTETQVDERSARQPSIIDRVFSIVFLVAQPFVAVVQYLIIALGASDWMDGTRSVPHWAATTGIVLVFLIPLAAAAATLVMLAQRRIAFWVPLLAMVVTTVMVLVLSAYAQKPDI